MSGGIAFGDLNQEQILDFQVKSSIDIYDGFSVKSIYILWAQLDVNSIIHISFVAL